MAKIQPLKGKSLNPSSHGGTAPPMPLLEPNSPFLLMAHRERYTIMFDSEGQGHVIASLRPLSLKGGSNGITTRKLNDGSIERDADAAVSSARKSGWILLDPAVVGKYRTAHDVRGGQHYVHMHTRVFAGSSHMEPDRDAYIAWCQKLQKAGHIPEPPPWLLEDLLGRYERQVARAESKRTAAGDRKAAQLRGVVDTLRAALGKEAAPKAPVADANAEILARLEAAERRAAEAEENEAKAKAEAKAAKAAKTKAEKAKAAAEAKVKAGEVPS